MRGSMRWKKRFNPKHCAGGDCLCAFHEGETDRLMSRAVSNKLIPVEVTMGLEELEDIPIDYCNGCSDCDASIGWWEDWQEGLRAEVAPLTVSFLEGVRICSTTS